MTQVPNPQMPPVGAGPSGARKPGGGGNMTLVLVAVGMGLLTVILTNLYITQKTKAIEGQTVTVYRIIKPLEVGHKLKEKDLRTHEIPEQYADSLIGVVIDKKGDRSTMRLQLEKRVMRPARENEYLSYDMFQDSGTIPEESIPTDHKAVPIPVDARGGVSGLLKPGMWIDILATIPEAGKVPQTAVVIERVKVLTVGRSTVDSGRMSTSFSSITVALKGPEAVQIVAIAERVGKDGFNIVVRRPDDTVTQYQGKVNPDVLTKLRIDTSARAR
ncbi:MAG: Flp pilus assembly protein CpaB [Phycisphaera sp.]|nr:Flp pilus assembly protein CpaB [Phycisphaera sp.]